MRWIEKMFLFHLFFLLIVIRQTVDANELLDAIDAEVDNEDANKKLSRNYASYECGAKVITSNPEAQHTSNILKESKDEYMLNPCKVKKWFVMELCEPIQPSSIELANFELFSSTPKELLVQGSDRFPTSSWILLGTFVANDTRELQRFEIKPQTEFIKFIKIDILSHYGSEHFCPFSLIRTFGVSLVEDFDAIENGQVSQVMVRDVNTNNNVNSNDNVKEEKDGNYKNVSLTDGNSSSEVASTETPNENVRENSVLQMVRKVFTETPAQQTPTTQTPTEPINETEDEDVHFYGRLIRMLPSIRRYLKDSKCFKNETKDVKTPTAVKTLLLQKKMCKYIEVMVTKIMYQKCLEYVDLSSDLSKISTCEVKNVSTLVGVSAYAKVSEDANKDANKKEDEKNASNIIRQQIKPIFDSMLALVTPSYDSVSVPPAEETSTALPTVPIPPPIDGITHVHAHEVSTTAAEDVNNTSVSADVLASTLNPTPVQDATSILASETASSAPIDSTDSVLSLPTATVSPPTSTPTPTSFEASASKETPSKETTPTIGVVAASSSKESIFIKINNRIKAIEQNMSINTELINELMIRHREQMIEVQRAFNQTHETFSEIKNSTQVVNEQLKERITSLEEQVSISNEQINVLIMEKELLHWTLIFWHLILILIELILIVTFANVYIRRISRIAMAVTAIEESRLANEAAKDNDDKISGDAKLASTGDAEKDDSEDDNSDDDDKLIQYQDINQSCDASTTSSSLFDTASYEGDANHHKRRFHDEVEGSSCDWSSNQLIIDSDKDAKDIINEDAKLDKS